MINKKVIESILERIEARVKKIGYHIKRDELDTGYKSIEVILEDISNIQTLLNRETEN